MISSHVKINLISSHVKISKTYVFLHDRNIFEDLLGNVLQPSVIFGNFRKMIGNVRMNFRQSFGSFRNLHNIVVYTNFIFRVQFDIIT